MEIFVRDKKTKKIYPIDVSPYNTVEEIKEKIEAVTGVPPINQKVTFGGKEFVFKRKLVDYGVEKGQTINMTFIERSEEEIKEMER